MKQKIALIPLLLIFLFSNAQENKFSTGDIGLQYALDFSGNIQQQLSVSGFVTKNLELGGIISFGYSTSRSSGKGTQYQQARSTDSLLTNYNDINKSWNYTVNVNPFLVYHFPIGSNLDLYTGGFLILGINNSSYSDVTTYTAPNFSRTDQDVYTNPPTYELGAGLIIGCQYFFYKRLAIGVQAGIGAAGSFSKGSEGFNSSEMNSGSNNGSPSTYTALNNFSINDKQLSLASSALAGVTLSFYFARKKKPHPEVQN